jgi:hypothetical protein
MLSRPATAGRFPSPETQLHPTKRSTRAISPAQKTPPNCGSKGRTWKVKTSIKRDADRQRGKTRFSAPFPRIARKIPRIAPFRGGRGGRLVLQLRFILRPGQTQDAARTMPGQCRDNAGTMSGQSRNGAETEAEYSRNSPGTIPGQQPKHPENR